MKPALFSVLCEIKEKTGKRSFMPHTIHLHACCSSIHTAVLLTIASTSPTEAHVYTDNSAFYTDRCFLTEVEMSCVCDVF